MLVTSNMIKAAVECCKKELDNLTRTVDGRHFSKVCCVCDRLVKYGKEKAISLEMLKGIKYRFAKSELGNDVRIACKRHYTIQCYSVATEHKYRYLERMALSRRAYAVKVKGIEALGCCDECYRGVAAMSKDISAPLPKYAIVNGLTIGPVPQVLSDLNEVELAMISPARINKHVFSFMAGAHKSIKGWHSMYYNDLEQLNGVMNYIIANDGENGESEDDGSSDDESEAGGSSVLEDTSNGERGEQSDSDSTQPDEDVGESKIKLPLVAIVLCGPFTARQRVDTLARTYVDWINIRRAVRWLKINNRMYADFQLPEDKIIQPILIDRR
jgi:hypothetical protein